MKIPLGLVIFSFFNLSNYSEVRGKWVNLKPSKGKRASLQQGKLTSVQQDRFSRPKGHVGVLLPEIRTPHYCDHNHFLSSTIHSYTVCNTVQYIQ